MSIIVAKGIYALLWKFLQKNSPHNVQTKGGGGSKAFWTMLKKTALFSRDGFPNDDGNDDDNDNENEDLPTAVHRTPHAPNYGRSWLRRWR